MTSSTSTSSHSTTDNDSQLSSTDLLLPRFISSLVNVPFRAWSLFRSKVYNALILNMTTRWYQVVLERLEPNSIVLDIGIGTAGKKRWRLCHQSQKGDLNGKNSSFFPAGYLFLYVIIIGALIQCQSLLKSKNIRVVGVDYDAHYVSEAQTAIFHQGLQDYISVVTMSVYDVPSKRSELTAPGGTKEKTNESSSSFSSPHQQFHAVYFSGSFSLLPDMVGAIQAVTPLLLQQTTTPNNAVGGKIYITQTYQRQLPFPMLLSYIKPLLRYLTTIDFGQLVTEQQAEDLFYRQIQERTCGMKVLEHEVMDRSVNTSMQAAYLTVLQVQGQGEQE
jgi:hypothetical protein